MMLYWESNIHFQVIELSAIGMVQGSRMIKPKDARAGQVLGEQEGQRRSEQALEDGGDQR